MRQRISKGDLVIFTEEGKEGYNLDDTQANKIYTVLKSERFYLMLNLPMYERTSSYIRRKYITKIKNNFKNAMEEVLGDGLENRNEGSSVQQNNNPDEQH